MSSLKINHPNCVANWNAKTGSCTFSDTNGAIFWQGNLIPACQLERTLRAQEKLVAYPSNVVIESKTCGLWEVRFQYEGFGSGRMEIHSNPNSSCVLEIKNLVISWESEVFLHSVIWGYCELSEQEQSVTPQWGERYWPNWRAEGYCVPCTGSSPTQSFWRSWDMGHAEIPLGSFGPSMGTPYAAAFPRPLYAAAMGKDSTWIAIGAGEIPNAAMTLKIRSASSCIEFLYREDLWGKRTGNHFQMNVPLRISFGENAYSAYRHLFASFPARPTRSRSHARSYRGTWGNFKEGIFGLREWIEEFKVAPADVLLIDDYWQEFNCSGTPHQERFPNFKEDIAHIQSQGIEIGIWNSLAWMDEPEKFGLSDEDLICDPDGKPRLSHWGFDPHTTQNAHYCLDPSSEKSRQFIVNKVQTIMREYQPAMLKFDFGYGLPCPNGGAPRNPDYRGERLSYELIKLSCEAAKAINPEVTIMLYSLHPMTLQHGDLLSLDDLGDAGDSVQYEVSGHAQRCMWASLVSNLGIPITTSSGYFWKAMPDILLNTAVIGVPGLLIADVDRAGDKLPDRIRSKLIAMNQWFRKSPEWTPDFYDSEMGSVACEPNPKSWGRMENDQITAVCLRGDLDDMRTYEKLAGVRFSGHWAVLSLDESDFRQSSTLAIIPFSNGRIEIEKSGPLEIETVHLDQTSALCETSDSGQVIIDCQDSDTVIGYIVTSRHG